MLVSPLAFVLAMGCSNTQRPARSGEQVFAGACSSCHQSSGEGSGRIYPPLAGSEWVVGDPDTLIRIVMHGIKGKIVVKGQTYDNIMSPWGAALTDAEIANVLTYVRTSWGNDAGEIAVSDVSRIRKCTRTAVSMDCRYLTKVVSRFSI